MDTDWRLSRVAVVADDGGCPDVTLDVSQEDRVSGDLRVSL
jgi:hypothetical protein